MKKQFAIVSVAALLAGIAWAQDDTPARKATPEDYKKFAGIYRKYQGKVSVGAKAVVIKIDDAAYQRDLKKAMSYPNAVQQKQATAMVERNYAAAKWALGKEFEFEMSEKVELRKMNLPFEFDEKGFPKVYSVAEKAKLRGTSGAPGYIGRIEDFGGDVTSLVEFSALGKDGKQKVVRVTALDNK